MYYYDICEVFTCIFKFGVLLLMLGLGTFMLIELLLNTLTLHFCKGHTNINQSYLTQPDLT